MPGDDADFAAYLAARWPSLVRTLVLLGCGRREAAEVARTGLVRCYTAWDGVRRADDVDTYVYAAVLGSLHKHRRRIPAPAREPVADDASDDERLRQSLQVQLDRLDGDERELVVLRFVAELTEAQAGDVLDVPLESAQARITHGLGRIDLEGLRQRLPTGLQPVSEIFHRAGESIEVLANPVDEVVAEARAQRRRRRRTVVVGVAAAALVLGGLTWWAEREPAEEDGPLPPAAVTRVKNPVQVAWYANGRLHLEKVAVSVPAVTELVELNGGAVYGDHEGTVAFVAADGQRRRIGHQEPDSPLVASSGEAWVAWIDPGEEGGAGPAIQVYDVSAGELLAARDVASTDVHLVAIDQRQVFYEGPDGAFAWTPGVETAVKLERTGLLDVESANRVYQVGGSIDMVQSFFNVSFARPGTGAFISPGGVLVLSKAPGPGVAEGRPFRPLLYDARSGARKPSGVGVGERAVDAAFSRNNTAIYFVAQVADLAGGFDLDGNIDPLLVLRTCDMDSGKCTDLAPVQSGADRPVLAH
jgi:DNA-directed RNA polymerase specialized sigma24 family protein